MLSLLGLGIHTPILMLGLVALSIPLAIHLLSKSRGRIVPFAHTALIKVKTSPRLRQLRLTQWWLLFLRCLLLLVATLLIANLYWQDTSRNDQHMLLTEDWLNHSTPSQKNQLRDNSQQQKWILLGQPNKILFWQEIQQWRNKQPSLTSTGLNLWQKVADYSASLTQDAAISVYTTNRFSQFIGQKVPYNPAVKWHIQPIETEINSNTLKQHILVLHDDKNTTSLTYLKAAFEALAGLEQLEVNLQFKSLNELAPSNQLVKQLNKTINLSDVPLVELATYLPALSHNAIISKAQLGDMTQAHFPLLLADLLLKKHAYQYLIENLRLSEQQIIATLNTPNKQSSSREDLNMHRHSLDIVLWVLLVLSFCLERLLSEWSRPRSNPVLGGY